MYPPDRGDLSTGALAGLGHPRPIPTRGTLSPGLNATPASGSRRALLAAMDRTPRALHAGELLLGARAPRLRRALRPALLVLTLVGAVVLSGWLAHAALAPALGGWPARALQTVGSWLRAAWSAGA
jgi:hypothetical protein